MLEIKKIIKEKYNINNINHVYINSNNQFIEFNLNAFASIKIYKVNNDYHLILSTVNSNSFPTKNVNINLKYSEYEKLISNLETFQFHFL